MALPYTSNKPFTNDYWTLTDRIKIAKPNLKWWLQRLPIALLVSASAYGIGWVASTNLPWPFNWLLGLGFEATYLGAMAFADQKLAKDNWIDWALWVFVNVLAVSCSIAFNLLFVSHGSYANITLEGVTESVPIPLLTFLYTLLLERNTTAPGISCPWCGATFATEAQKNGHLGQCKSKP